MSAITRRVFPFVLTAALAAAACAAEDPGSMDPDGTASGDGDASADTGDGATTGDETATDGDGGGDGDSGDGGSGDGDGDGDGDTTGTPPDDDPPPAVVRILPLGDSLTLGFGSGTEGTGSEAGYRLRLSNLLAGDGIDFDFVGSNQNGPGALADKDHEGFNGYAVPQVAEVAATAVPAHDPHVVLLMAGTNDQIVFVPPSQPPADAASDMESLIAQIHADAPGAQIVVAQIIPLTFNDEGVREYNSLLPAIVERQQGEGVPVRLVDMYAIGRENLSSDGIHPTAKGYELMADIWYPALLEAIEDL